MQKVLNFSQFFHQFSKKMRGSIPADTTKWPQNWTTIEYKLYERFPKIELDSRQQSADFFDLLQKRNSRRDFSKRSISKEKLSTLLQYAAGLKQVGGRDRMYPSAGARYPLEIYPIVFTSSEGVPTGLYHYDVQHHQLDILLQKVFTEDERSSFFSYPWAKNTSLAIIITACFERNQRKYSERGYRHILIETGHVSQNLYLIAEALDLKCCAISGIEDEYIEKLLDIDGVTESLVGALVFD